MNALVVLMVVLIWFMMNHHQWLTQAP